MKKLLLGFVSASLFFASCKKSDRAIIETPDDETITEASGRKCASQEVLEEQLKADPKRARNLEELERKTELFAARDQSQFRTAGILYIPVVVNVVLSNNSRVTDAQIQSQLDVLTDDFNKANTELSRPNLYLAGYSLADVANCQVEFYIENWTNDVNRKETTLAFGSNDAVKRTSSGGLDPESPTTKMNMWVCDLSSGLLGYAQFPGGPAATDGVVIDYQAFGTDAATSYAMYSQFNLGRTATHEVGHWLNLRHIWGDARCGNDFVGDTPAHDESNGGCPAVNLKSRCAGKPLEQWMNYMDYTDDRCMYMFSAGQKTRMDAAIDASRAAYVRTTRG
jgi:hypothetical protein